MNKKTENLFRKILKLLEPPKDFSLADWADKYRKLSSESSVEPGQWHTNRAPYQREILNAISDPKVRTVVVMAAAQIGKTDGFILNTIAYYISQDPGSMIVMMPTISLAEGFSKERLSPMIRDMLILSKKIDNRSRTSGNTIMKKSFMGGYLALIGANSPVSLSSRPARILLCDEVDRFPITSGDEGDPLLLAEKRQSTFWNSKEIILSTPTIKDASRIDTEFRNSTQHHWQLPCPTCGEYQELSWKQIIYDKENLEKIHMVCKFCGAMSTETDWKEQQRAGKGKYVAEFPTRNVKGFHVNAFASPWMTWRKIVEDFIKAEEQMKIGNVEFLKVWINTVLGEVWEERGDQIDENKLMERRELYNCEVPLSVLILTAGVDVQDDRLECEVVGWSTEKESYGIQYTKFFGDPHKDAVWEQLYIFLRKTFHRADGTELRISCTCIDTGGHCTQEVYKFCRGKEGQKIFAIKGRGGVGIPFINNPTKNNRYQVPLFSLGVDSGKDTVYNRLRIKEVGGGYCHFPLEPEKGYSKEYFEMLTAEKKIVSFSKKTCRASFIWVLKEKGARNEAFDIRNYATAAVEILNPQLSPLKEVPPKKKRRTGVVHKGL